MSKAKPIPRKGSGQATNSTITIARSSSRKYRVEMDIDKLERLAEVLGLYNPEFLKGLEQSEKDYREGRYRKISSLKELRSK